MNKYRLIDKSNWNRKNTFEFFNSYEDPFFSITAKLEVDNLLRYCKENKESFFLHSLYIGARAANEIEEFRMRIQGNDVVAYEKVNYGSPVLHDDNTFTFAYFEYDNNQDICVKNSEKAMKNELEDPRFDPRHNLDDMIHFSVLPWIEFSSIKHARRMPVKDSIPKIVYGKYSEDKGKFTMPVSIDVHHALMDGFHVGQYLKKWQELEEKLYR